MLSKELEDEGRAATLGGAGAAAALHRLRRDGAGAERLPAARATTGFRPGWEEIGREPGEATTRRGIRLPAAVHPICPLHARAGDPRHLARRRALGFSGGRVLEPGMGTGLFFALMPETLRDTTRLTGIEYDPITARIARADPPARRGCAGRTTPAARSPAASTWRSAIRRSRTGWSRPTRPRPSSACACTTTSSPARSSGCGRAGWRSS